MDAPWWQEVGDVVDAAKARFGIQATVTRLLASERSRPPGGWVAYLAESEDVLPDGLLKVNSDLALVAERADPRRATWAVPGGHSNSLAWVREVWPEGGNFRGRQQRTWNLSSLWQLQAERGSRQATTWLKQVPPFLAHEAIVLRWLGAAIAGVSPNILASGSAGRMLLEHVDGADCYDAPAVRREKFAQILHQIQLASIPAIGMLAMSGVPDRRGARLASELRARLSGCVANLPRTALLLERLDSYMTCIDDCGVPDVLVHGDFHPGNVRSADGKVTILDWGDSFLGNPAFDLLRLCEGVSGEAAAALSRGWSSTWKQRNKACQPERALALTRPLAPLLAAATYARFVEQIEASERSFHAADVGDQLKLTERLLAERSD